MLDLDFLGRSVSFRLLALRLLLHGLRTEVDLIVLHDLIGRLGRGLNLRSCLLLLDHHLRHLLHLVPKLAHLHHLVHILRIGSGLFGD